MRHYKITELVFVKITELVFIPNGSFNNVAVQKLRICWDGKVIFQVR